MRRRPAWSQPLNWCQAEMDLIRCARREIFRAAVFLCITPFWVLAMMSGWAVLRASAAAALSPDAIASSTLRTKVRTRVRRALLTSVRFTAWRAAFLAELVFAIYP